MTCSRPGLSCPALSRAGKVTTNEPHSKEEKNWVDYYTYLQNAAGPLVAVMKDVDTYFSHHRSAVFGDGMSTLHKRCGVEGAVCDGTYL